MESFFFNITDTRYKKSIIYENEDEHLYKIDISNGVIFLDIDLKSSQTYDIKNLDRMVMICVSKYGDLEINDHIENKTHIVKNSSVDIFCSSRQDLSINTSQNKSGFFILFIADFFLKRYLASSKNEPIDFLYNKIQDEVSLELLNSYNLDALSLYIIDKITNIDETQEYLKSIRCEHNVVEFLIHRLSLCDIVDEEIDEEELSIVKKAKNILLSSFVNPPSINELAHLCATNESKLKKSFKKVYNYTIYGYVQKLRLDEANMLLKEQTHTIGEVAKKVGYKHQGHFSKLFFQTYGVYPKDLVSK